VKRGSLKSSPDLVSLPDGVGDDRFWPTQKSPGFFFNQFMRNQLDKADLERLPDGVGDGLFCVGECLEQYTGGQLLAGVATAGTGWRGSGEGVQTGFLR
jgi:hypothetical protein